MIIELEDSGTFFLIHSCSLYCNALDEPLLCQSTVMTPDHRLFLRRAVGLDIGQVHGSGDPDLYGGDR